MNFFLLVDCRTQSVILRLSLTAFAAPPFAVFLNENDKNCVDGGIVDESQRSNGKMVTVQPRTLHLLQSP